VNSDGIAITLKEASGDHVGFMVGSGVRWRGVNGNWHNGDQVECLPPLSRGASVELDVVRVDGRDVVVEARCATLPTRVNFAEKWAYPGQVAPFPGFDTYCEAIGDQPTPVDPGTDDPCTS
jgi:hypothetical protein